MTRFAADALLDDHIVITGASGGIGWATAIEAVQVGAKVTINGRRAEQLEALKTACEETASDAQVFIHTGDITKESDRASLAEQARKTFGPVTKLVNAAGIIGGGPVEELTENDLDQVMQANYNAAVMLTQTLYPDMKSRGSGAVVNVSSLSGLRGTYGNTAYSASKFALIGFTQCFALEAIEHGVRVNAVCPGFVDTDMARGILSRKAEQAGLSFDEQWQLTEDSLPSGRITTPEEVASSIIFLLTDAAENIVGESMKISGGGVMR
ncbi:3-oxoacyl-[acyl-carrier protein] reductase [Salsuginibacillus halophilus]|uniref:3-oxoacyl-[acyl-carrier protein] reductase n=1 Tax=Salsuginibacillus halophilus TaxID=517424 RepID=A0A2P8H3R9_9BACI|nr:SDR family oxidoreductase [Salsuginibacillus halophilus]PSL40849.1 3-oxoacyl-[acyl-carrier protein] reductase [Salsuginibacillus halophilus]